MDFRKKLIPELPPTVMSCSVQDNLWIRTVDPIRSIREKRCKGLIGYRHTHGDKILEVIYLTTLNCVYIVTV